MSSEAKTGSSNANVENGLKPVLNEWKAKPNPLLKDMPKATQAVKKEEAASLGALYLVRVQTAFPLPSENDIGAELGRYSDDPPANVWFVRGMWSVWPENGQKVKKQTASFLALLSRTLGDELVAATPEQWADDESIIEKVEPFQMLAKHFPRKKDEFQSAEDHPYVLAVSVVGDNVLPLDKMMHIMFRRMDLIFRSGLFEYTAASAHATEKDTMYQLRPIKATKANPASKNIVFIDFNPHLIRPDTVIRVRQLLFDSSWNDNEKEPEKSCRVVCNFGNAHDRNNTVFPAPKPERVVTVLKRTQPPPAEKKEKSEETATLPPPPPPPPPIKVVEKAAPPPKEEEPVWNNTEDPSSWQFYGKIGTHTYMVNFTPVAGIHHHGMSVQPYSFNPAPFAPIQTPFAPVIQHMGPMNFGVPYQPAPQPFGHSFTGSGFGVPTYENMFGVAPSSALKSGSALSSQTSAALSSP